MKRGRERQLHLMGLVSDGGVHSHIDHLFHLLRMAQQNKVERVFVHCFLDGRDTPPHSGIDYLRQLQQKMRELGVGRIASLVGRYYAMDRDNRWERVERAYRAVVHGEAERRSADPIDAVRKSYEQGITDEFVEPVVITTGSEATAKPLTQIRDEDAVIFFNFRADRARQMTRAIAEPGFDKFTDPARPKDLFFVAMSQYDKTFSWLRFLFGPEKLEHILAQVFAEIDFRNLRVAETEKYAHVTYFFNGGVEKPFAGEERILVPSPKVATYDLKPEMSAEGIADSVVQAIEKGRVRRGDHEFRERRHGRAFGQAGGGDSRGRGGGLLPGAHLSGAAPARRRLDHHRGSRQRRDHDRSGDRRPAHLSHHESRAVYSARSGRPGAS